MRVLSRRNVLKASAAGSVILVVGAQAQQPTGLRGAGRIFAGFPAGGTIDAIARRLADSFKGAYPDGLIVENKPGAGGRLAVEALKGTPPDGLSLLLTPESLFTIYPHYYKKLSYDPVADVTPVSAVATLAFGFAIGPKVPESVKTLADFITWVKANPAAASFGSPATGSMPHFVGDRFNRLAKAGMQHVPYRGSAPAIQDLIGGHQTATITPLGEYLPQLASGKIRLLAVSSAQRSRFSPSTPTFAESGFPDLTALETYGLYLPGKAEAAAVARAAALVRQASADPAVVSMLNIIGFEASADGPAAYAAYLAKQREIWGPLVRESGFSSDE